MGRPDCPSEETLHEFLLRRAQGGTTGALEDHLDTCDDCRRLVGRLAGLGLLLERPPEGVTGDLISPQHASFALIPGATIGRFTLIEKVGAGAMGQVFAAQDPKLDRKIALKILRKSTSWGSDIEARILSEAQSLARIFHPNVVTVYDVGFDGGHFFMAMALIEGTTLRRWAVGRTPTEIIAQYAAAARGLAAAHRQGVVHGDFKPDNVLVDLHGNVFVTDFGLARFFTPSDATPAAGSTAGGTPHYMAPEQHWGTLNAAADQYAFAVSLYESVYGHLPFRGISRAELWAEKQKGFKTVPADPPISSWFQRALRQALSPEPQDRFRDMESLIKALAGPPQLSWLRALTMSLAVLALLAGAALFLIKPPCPPPEEQMAGIWDSSRQTGLATVFARREEPFAPFQRRLDNYVERWSNLYRVTCSVPLRPWAESGARGCLEGRRLELQALVELLAEDDPTVLAQASLAAAQLQSPETCFGYVQPRPEAPAAGDHRKKLARARMYEASGQLPLALELTEPILTFATRGGFSDIEAEVRILRGHILRLEGRYAAAQAELEAAIWAAEASDHREAAAAAWVELIPLQTIQNDAEGAIRSRRHAEALLSALGAGASPTRLTLLQESAFLSIRAGKYSRRGIGPSSR